MRDDYDKKVVCKENEAWEGDETEQAPTNFCSYKNQKEGNAEFEKEELAHAKAQGKAMG